MRTKAAYLAIPLVLAGLALWQDARISALADSVGSLRAALASMNVQLARVSETASTTEASSAANLAELARRQQVESGSQDQSLQNAVAAVTPTVVSIVESKEVPQLSVSYVNPFGNDPFFQGFGMQVPVYQQVGTTTQQVGAGTGFLVRPNGYIVTNKHVVPDANASYTVLLSNGSQKTATVVWRSPAQDIAIVKIPGAGYPTVSLGDSSSLKLGESVFAVGNALGQYNNSVSVGVVSGLNRDIQAQSETGVETLSGVIQTDAAINPGNSGGPLVNLAGDVIGINVAMVQGSENIGFSIPVNQVKSALAQLGI